MPWRRDRLSTPVFLGFPGGSDTKESAFNVRNLGLITGMGRSLGVGHGNPLRYSCLENPHGQRSLAGYSPWCHKESDMTKRTHTYLLWFCYLFSFSLFPCVLYAFFSVIFRFLSHFPLYTCNNFLTYLGYCENHI